MFTRVCLKGFNKALRFYTLPINYQGRRTLLSQAYNCREAWNERLDTPLLQKLDVGEFAIKLQEKLDKEGFASAIDIDILANKLEKIKAIQFDFAQNIFYRFRHCNEAVSVQESTPYALIRALLDRGETDRLLTILRDKIHFGIFLDYFTANMLLDHFIETKQYSGAVQIATDMMLQEDFAHPITRMLSWYACHLHLKHSKPSESETPVETEEDDEEENLVRVKYIQNPYYDDHFDIPKESMLLGKTLTMVAKFEDTILGRSYQLIGWALYEKFDKGLELMREWSESEKEGTVDKEAIAQFKKILDSVETKEPSTEMKDRGSVVLADLYPYITEEKKSKYLSQFQNLSAKLEAAGKIVDGVNLEDLLIQLTKQYIDKVEAKDIEDQKDLFQQWITDRQKLLDAQIKQYEVEMTKENLVKRLEHLQAKEEKLRYFEEIDKIRLGISRSAKEEKKTIVQQEDYYVPPPSERSKML